MYRNKFKHKDTGQIVLLWSDYNPDTKEYEASEDLLWTKPVDINQYEEMVVDTEGLPFRMFGIECGKGWYSLIQPIIDWIDDYNSKLKPDYKTVWPIEITQCKEKYSYLHFYVSYGTEELFNMIREAEKESQETCEFCGSKEHLGQTQGYYMTVCHDCIKKMAKERNCSYQWLSYDDKNVYWINPDGTEELISSKEKYEEDMP